MITDKIYPIIYNGVAKGIGTVSWSWTDDEGQMYIIKLNNLLYSIYSPVNIPIKVALAESMKNYEGTWVLSKKENSFLLGILGSKKNTISH